ncbi:hypothetical protein COO60DRAFT_1530799 [Scenedesmus sp. NREL 46B-D3]|nr:hypothetical protein COO60DRAFT_1530799 [Scenedesmus sp. NREL 46B-D3]
MLSMPAVPGRLQLLLLLVAALLALLAPAPVYSHGSLTVPRSRNVVSPIQGQTWWKDHGNGHGAQVVKPLNGPGVCGDPYQHYGDASFYSRSPGAIQATYSAGATINVQWWIQVNHGGRIGVKLCNRRDNIDQACFDQFQLQRADGLGPFVYIMGGASMGTLGTMSANFRLPAGVSCAGGCVLQWEYLTMNSCFEPCPNAGACGVYANRQNPVTGQFNMANCCVGFSCSAADVPEIFRNCADIAITGGGGGTPTPPPPTGGCSSTAVSGGACGSGTCCPSGQCCSQYGWCGTTSQHCTTGCQSSWGTCGGTPNPCTSTAASGGSCGGGTCCPSGQCCSQWGYCGTTSQHCSSGCQRTWGSCWSATASASGPILYRTAHLPLVSAAATEATPSPTPTVDEPAVVTDAGPTPDADVVATAAATTADEPAAVTDAFPTPDALTSPDAAEAAAAVTPVEPVTAESVVVEGVAAAGSP